MRFKKTQKFRFPQNVVETFTEGDCWLLAQTIEAETGHTIVTTSYGHDFWSHAGNRLPNGFIVDIEGTHTEAEWLRSWTKKEPFIQDKLFVKEWTPKAFIQEMADLECERDTSFQEISKDVKFYAGEVLSRVVFS